MLIFVVNYKESELNTFECYAPESPEVAHEFVETPTRDHSCGYLVEGGQHHGVPKLQRRKFCGSDKAEDFIRRVQAEAQPLTSADVLRLHEERRDYINRTRKEMKAMARKKDDAAEEKTPKAKKEKVSKETNGEAKVRADRFSPDPKSKIKKLVDKNPRKADSVGYKNFEIIRSGMTVAKYKEAGGKMGYLKTELKNKTVELEQPAG